MNWRCSDNSDEERGGIILVGIVATWPSSVPRATVSHCLGEERSGRLSLSLCPSATSWCKRERPEMIPRQQYRTLCMKTTETRVYAEVRTRTKSTDTFYVGKSREILAVLALLRTWKSFLYANLVKGKSDISLIHLPSQPQKKSRSRANSVAWESWTRV